MRCRSRWISCLLLSLISVLLLSTFTSLYSFHNQQTRHDQLLDLIENERPPGWLDAKKDPGTSASHFSHRRALPRFHLEGGTGNSMGGVLVFYHIAKTGGTTIRENIVHGINATTFEGDDRYQLGRLKFERVFNNKGLQKIRPRIAAILSGELKDRSSDVLFVELHGTIPSLLELQPLLREWRGLSDVSSIPFFAFTLVREPLQLYSSYFLAFHNLHCRHFWCEMDALYERTPDNLIQSALPNRQCVTMFYGQRRLHQYRQSLSHLINSSNQEVSWSQPSQWFPNVSRADCLDTVWQTLERDWDWVGTTNDLQTVTLPLLTLMLLGNQTIGTMLLSFNRNSVNQQQDGTITSSNQRQKQSLQLAHLDERTIRQLRELAKYDLKLYDRIQKHFQWDRRFEAAMKN